MVANCKRLHRRYSEMVTKKVRRLKLKITKKEKKNSIKSLVDDFDAGICKYGVNIGYLCCAGSEQRYSAVF